MKLQRLIQKVYYEPALITPDAHASIRQLLESRLGREIDSAIGAVDSEAKQRTTTICGDEVDLPSMHVDGNGIAHIPIGGAIGQGLGNFAKWAGAVDVADIEADLMEAEENPKVRGIILDMDSPGGMVSGTPELAQVIEGVQKRIYAFSNGLIASAAYWLASATDGIFLTMAAEAGSIGVYQVVYDESQAFQDAGIKVEVIKAGKFKGDGIPGTSLSDDARAHLQEGVLDIYKMFTGHVLKHRPNVAEDTMQGQTFLAQRAVERKLVDAIVKNKAEVVANWF
jgi:signal peptide peptidase SppA